MKRLSIIALAVLMCALATPLVTVAATPNDSVALQGVKTGKAVFDINLSGPEKLPLYLQVIKETHDSLIKQGVKPVMVVAFRGMAVRLVSSERKDFTAEQKDLMDDADKLIVDLAKKGIRFEACAVASRLFKIDNATILPNVKVVGNTFISLIGYQARGYAIIPIQ